MIANDEANRHPMPTATITDDGSVTTARGVRISAMPPTTPVMARHSRIIFFQGVVDLGLSMLGVDLDFGLSKTSSIFEFSS